MNLKFKAATLTLIIQAILAMVLFVGFLLDPLVGMIIIGIYFWILGFFLIFYFIMEKLKKHPRGTQENNLFINRINNSKP